MADFNQATTSPTNQSLTVGATPISEGSNNSGFGISPTYVNATEFSSLYLQAATSPASQEVDMGITRYRFAKPLDNRVVPMAIPLPMT